MRTRVALIAAALLASTVALAHPPGGKHGPDMDRMAILLDLNDTQKAQVQQIFDEQHQKLDAVHEQARSAGTKPSREERRKFHEEMKQDTTAKLQAVLSADQMKKFAALTDHGHGRHGQHDRHDAN
jgi:Spy/CpxP family protein refolding chaperone